MEGVLEYSHGARGSCSQGRGAVAGSMEVRSGKREAELLITGDHYTMRFRNGDIYVGRFTVDPTQKPRAMDMVIEEGPEPYRGKVAMAIYEFDGDHLLWCPGKPDRGERSVPSRPTTTTSIFSSSFAGRRAGGDGLPRGSRKLSWDPGTDQSQGSHESPQAAGESSRQLARRC